MKTKPSFIKQAFLLTIISLLMRTIGTAFMIYISNTIGAEGIGLYQLTYSVYFLFITLSTSGVSMAVTRIVSEQVAVKNHVQARLAFCKCFCLSVILGVLSSVSLYIFAEPMAVGILKDIRTIYSLKVLAIGLPFLSTASVVRGYFLGVKRGITAASTDIVEVIVQMIATLILLKTLAPKGIEFACAALVISTTISEVISCVYSIALFFLQKKTVGGDKKAGLNRKIFSIIIPVSISNYIRSALSTVENVSMPQGLKKFGEHSSEALGQYGMIKGMTMPILLFPSAILTSFSNLLIPEVSSLKAIENKKRIEFIIAKSIKTTLIFSFLIMAIFLIFANDIGILLYKNQKVGIMLAWLTPLVPLLYLDMIVDSILKGLNQQVSSMKYNTVDAVIRAAIIVLLVPVIGMKGYIIMLYVGTIFNALLSINRLIVVSKVRFAFVGWVVKPIVSAIIAGLITVFVLTTGAVIKILFLCFTYIVMLISLKCVTKGDINWVMKFLKNNA